MTAPVAPSNIPPGYVQLPGGYVPNPPAGGQPTGAPQLPPGFGPPAPAGQNGAPAAPAPIDPRTQYVPTGPAGDPFSTPAPLAPAPAPVQGQPLGAPQFVQAPPQQQVPQNQLGARLSGEGIPVELQGRTLGDVLQLYDRMRGIVLERAAAQAPPARPVPPQPQAQAPNGQQGQPAPQGQPGWDWRNPQESISRVVQEQLQPLHQALAPMMQQNAQQAVRQARDTVAAELGHTFTSIEPLVLERMSGADPAALQNPQLWRLAAQSVVGELALRGQLPQGAGQQGPPAQNPWLRPAQPVPFAGGQPLPNLNGFFSEQPTHGAPPTGAPQLSSTQLWAAQAMGMSVADYQAWSGGIPVGGSR